jgi:hypothetical protein
MAQSLEGSFSLNEFEASVLENAASSPNGIFLLWLLSAGKRT